MAKSIKQLAEDIGVSKTAIRKKIENLGLRECLQKSGNQFVVGEEVEHLIKQAFEKKIENRSQTKTETETETESKIENLDVSEIFSLLKAELEEKNRQIAVLEQQLTKAQQLIDQAQQLHAVDVQKIRELEQKERENNDLEETEPVTEPETTSEVLVESMQREKESKILNWFKRIWRM